MLLINTRREVFDIAILSLIMIQYFFFFNFGDVNIIKATVNSSEDPGGRRLRNKSIAKQFLPGYDLEFTDEREKEEKGIERERWEM